MTKVCICGGGSLGHVCAGVLSSREDVQVNILTRQPERWASTLEVRDPEGKVFAGSPHLVSSHAGQALDGCDIVFLCLPGFAIEETLRSIKPFVGRAIVGSIVSSTGFFFVAHRMLGEDAPLFGFQRTPFIARTEEYGRSANLLGYKPQLCMALENVRDADGFRQLVERLWITPTRLLSSHYEVSLTNSNPILHTGRLYAMWKDWNGEVFDHNIPFYKEWTDEASQTIIRMDEEFFRLLDVLPVRKGAIPSLLEYYESHDATSLSHKIRSIAAFKSIPSPMKEVEGGWIPDFGSRYFAEDFPYGLYYIWMLAHQRGIYCPNIDKVYEWGMSKVEGKPIA